MDILFVLDLQSELSLVIKEISLKQFIAIFKNKNPMNP